MAEVRVELHHDEIAEFATSDEVRDALMDAALPVEVQATADAPRRTGRGAESIRREPVLDGLEWEVRVSWEQIYYYMYFHEKGTKYLLARPFLEPALRG